MHVETPLEHRFQRLCALTKATSSGTQFKGKCPAQKDSEASLSLKLGDGRILLNKALNKKDIRKYNLLAFVVKKNVKSKKFFLNLGFKFLKNNKFIMKAK